MKDEKGWHRCPFCDEAHFTKKEMMHHVFDKHIMHIKTQYVFFGMCWCGEKKTVMFKDWVRHLRKHGGLHAHYHAYLLGVEP